MISLHLEENLGDEEGSLLDCGTQVGFRMASESKFGLQGHPGWNSTPGRRCHPRAASVLREIKMIFLWKRGGERGG